MGSPSYAAKKIKQHCVFYEQQALDQTTAEAMDITNFIAEWRKFMLPVATVFNCFKLHSLWRKASPVREMWCGKESN